MLRIEPTAFVLTYIPRPQTLFVGRISLGYYLAQVGVKLGSPAASAAQSAGMLGVHHHTWLFLFLFFPLFIVLFCFGLHFLSIYFSRFPFSSFQTVSPQFICHFA